MGHFSERIVLSCSPTFRQTTAGFQLESSPPPLTAFTSLSETLSAGSGKTQSSLCLCMILSNRKSSGITKKSPLLKIIHFLLRLWLVSNFFCTYILFHTSSHTSPRFFPSVPCLYTSSCPLLHCWATLNYDSSPKIDLKRVKIIGQKMVSGSTVWRLTGLMLSPVTHCHAGYIYVSSRAAGSIKIDLNQSSFSRYIWLEDFPLHCQTTFFWNFHPPHE